MIYDRETIKAEVDRVNALGQALRAQAREHIEREGLIGLDLGTMGRVREIADEIFGSDWETLIRGGMTCPPEIVPRRFLGRVAPL